MLIASFLYSNRSFQVNCANVLNGEFGFCTCNQCSENEGDCDLDEECQGDLVCGSNNCLESHGFDSEIDCCTTKAVVGDENFCTSENQCGVDEGDCDTHDECQDGLRCGSNNCPDSLGFHYEFDCCYQPPVGDEHFCTNTNPCGEDEGDCDSHDECHNNQFCGYKNCPDSLGFASNIDCCYNATYLDACMYPFEHKQRIVGGVPAESPIPWQVFININDMLVCGGTILDDVTILSAAHCFENHDSPSTIRAGSLQRYAGGQVGYPFYVCNIKNIYISNFL